MPAMPDTRTLTEAFAFHGTRTHNIRQAWSAISDDGSTVAITIWNHDQAADGSIDYIGAADGKEWHDRWGNRERARHLQHALDHCGGQFRVVRVYEETSGRGNKRLRRRFADPDTVMQITRFDPSSGEFAARPV